MLTLALRIVVIPPERAGAGSVNVAAIMRQRDRWTERSASAAPPTMQYTHLRGRCVRVYSGVGSARVEIFGAGGFAGSGPPDFWSLI